MSLDFEKHLSAVERSVSLLERDGKPAGTVTLCRSVSTTLDDLWDAVTNGERIGRWLLPISGELEPGGRYQLEGNAGGVITACERLSRVALTWEYAGDVSWVEVRCSGHDVRGARLELVHTALLSPHWDHYGPGAAGVGWELGLLGLALHVADPDAPRPDEAVFAASPEGKALITGSSEAWGQAAIDAGTEPAIARTAVRRTTAFYTGVPAE